MAKNKKKKSTRSTIFKLSILLLLVSIVSGYYYGHFIAPTDYKVTSKTITSDNLLTSASDVKIGFISDIHLKDKEDISRLKEIVTTMNKQSFDIVIFGGDLYDAEPFSNAEVISILKDIKSSYGKFAVQGEKDFLYSNDVISVLSDSGFEVLHNEYRKIHYKDTAFALFGLENNGDISSLLNDDNREMFKMVVVHEPDYFGQLQAQDIDLQLSGHSMGGYVDLPIYGPVFKKTNAETYVNGTYEKNQSTLIISNGLGLESSHEYRLFCPNEVISITVKGTKELPKEEPPVEETPVEEEVPPEEEVINDQPTEDIPVEDENQQQEVPQ